MTSANEHLDLLIDGLATYRLTRLVTADVLTEPARAAVVSRALAKAGRAPGDEPTAVEVVEAVDDPPKLARLVTCRWCTGVWIAGGVVVARRVAPAPWRLVARGLALSAMGVLLARLEDG